MADMLMTHPTADWQPLYDVHYRKIEIGEMLWDSLGDLSRFNVAGAPFGGPLALRKDEKKALVSDGSSTRPSIKIFSGSGRSICNISWDSKSRVAGFGWTDSEKLVLVLENGSVRIYNIHGDMVNSFSLGEEVKRQRVLEVDVWGAGMVVLTKQYQFCSVDEIDDPNPELLADTGLDSPPTSWAVIQPQFTGHSGVEVLVGTPDGSILVVEADRCGDQQLSNGPFTKMSVSPTGKILATFTSSGQLWVVSTDFSQNLSEFNTKSKVPPTQLVWCGTDAVVMYWENPSLMLLVGPYGDWLKYNYDQKIHLVSEVDGVRIVTMHESEYLQRVPNVTEDIFKIASTSAASKLYDAMEHFHRKSPRADELIRIIAKALLETVNSHLGNMDSFLIGDIKERKKVKTTASSLDVARSLQSLLQAPNLYTLGLSSVQMPCSSSSSWASLWEGLVSSHVSCLLLTGSGMGDVGVEALCNALRHNRSVSFVSCDDSRISVNGLLHMVNLLRVRSFATFAAPIGDIAAILKPLPIASRKWTEINAVIGELYRLGAVILADPERFQTYSMEAPESAPPVTNVKGFEKPPPYRNKKQFQEWRLSVLNPALERHSREAETRGYVAPKKARAGSPMRRTPYGGSRSPRGRESPAASPAQRTSSTQGHAEADEEEEEAYYYEEEEAYYGEEEEEGAYNEEEEEEAGYYEEGYDEEEGDDLEVNFEVPPPPPPFD